MSTHIYLGKPPANIEQWIKARKRELTRFKVNGNWIEKDIVGTLTSQDIPSSGTLTEVEIGSHVTSIQDAALQDWSDLERIFVPGSISVINEYQFALNSNLKSVILENGITQISNNAFSGCGELINITMPASITSIDSKAFEYCSSLNKIVFEGNAPTIANDAFDVNSHCVIYVQPNSTGWGTTIPGTLNGINITYAGYTYVTYSSSSSSSFWSDNITGQLSRTIPDITFAKDVIIGSNVTSIGETALAGMLEYVVIPDSVVSIGNQAFNLCNNLTNITIPDSVVSIGQSAFYNCTQLGTITLGNKLATIGANAFQGCSVEELILPSSITTIGENAFGNCENLMYIRFNNKTKAEVQSMQNYSWQLPVDCTINCSDGDIVIE